MSSVEDCFIGGVSGRSCSSASSSNHEAGDDPSHRCRSPRTPPWIDDWAEALQSPRSSLSSNARYDRWVTTRAAYHSRRSSDDADSRRGDNFVSEKIDLRIN